MTHTIEDLPIASIGARNEIYLPLVITRGKNIILDDDVRIDAFARIEGGQGVWIHQGTHIASFASILGGGLCHVGKWCAISQGVKIITGTGHPGALHFPFPPPLKDVMYPKVGEVRIGDYVFIGANAIILPNVTIGEGAIIVAGTIISHNVDPWMMMGGNPARPVLKRENWMKHDA